MEIATFYLIYVGTVVASGYWAYRDARARDRPHPRALALTVSLLFPIGILWYVVSR